MQNKLPTYSETQSNFSATMKELLRLRDLGEDVIGQEMWYDVIAAVACLDRVQRDVDDILFDDSNVFTLESEWSV